MQNEANWYRLKLIGVQYIERNGADGSKLVQAVANWCKLKQCGAAWSKLVQQRLGNVYKANMKNKDMSTLIMRKISAQTKLL